MEASDFNLLSLYWQDFDFVLKGLARLLTNPLTQTYLPNSTKKIQFHQELLVLFWKLCDFNKVGITPEMRSNFDDKEPVLNFSFVFPLTEVPVFCPEKQ